MLGVRFLEFFSKAIPIQLTLLHIYFLLYPDYSFEIPKIQEFLTLKSNPFHVLWPGFPFLWVIVSYLGLKEDKIWALGLSKQSNTLSELASHGVTRRKGSWSGWETPWPSLCLEARLPWKQKSLRSDSQSDGPPLEDFEEGRDRIWSFWALCAELILWGPQARRSFHCTPERLGLLDSEK